MKAGDKVLVIGRKRTLVRPLADIVGGWEIDRPVNGLRYWNSGDMRIIRGDK